MNLNDPYENLTHSNVFYTIKNLPTRETNDKFEEIFTTGCKCQNICTLNTNCSCLQKYGINYYVNSNINLHNCYILNDEKIKSGIYECNSSCNCKRKQCGNRLVQFGPRNHLEIRDSQAKGQGLYTNEKIVKGCFICEYAGEIITESEATKRFKHTETNQLMNYIICLREHFQTKTITTYIDPTTFGNIGRYLNHSCNPNCVLVPVRIDHVVPELSIFAKNQIEINEELTFDYGDGEPGNVSMNVKLKECLCGEINCRKWLPFCTNICT